MVVSFLLFELKQKEQTFITCIKGTIERAASENSQNAIPPVALIPKQVIL